MMDIFIIWNNKNILLEGKSIFWQTWFDKGIIFIHDFINPDGTWMSYKEFNQKYGLRTNFLRYLGILSIIKKASKHCNVDIALKPEIDFASQQFILWSGRNINLKKANSKDFYFEYVDFELEPAASYRKWVLKHQASEDLYYKSLSLVKQCTTEPKLLAIQFKIVHYITNCGENLKKWNIAEENVCKFCQTNEIDTVVHALYGCELTWKYIMETFQLIDRTNTADSLLTAEAFIFGVEDPALNLILLLMKKCILNGRTFHNGYISPYLFLSEICKRIKVDHQNMLQERFNERWSRFQNLVERSLTSS